MQSNTTEMSTTLEVENEAMVSSASALAHQFLFNKMRVPFYQRMYANVDIATSADLATIVQTIPVMTKAALRRAAPRDFLPQVDGRLLGRYALHRSTGGTTGTPTSISYSRGDWERAVRAHASVFSDRMGDSDIRAYNGYNQGHISGPIFSESIFEAGGLCATRGFQSNDEAALRELVAHQCNVVISPPTASKKGGTIEGLLEIDATTGTEYLNGDNIQMLVVSSSELTPSLLGELHSLGINTIVNCYGCTEVMPVGFSCPLDPFSFHIAADAGTFVAVVSPDGALVESGERGIVLLSRFGAHDVTGQFVPSLSTALLNYVTGDEATYTNGLCACGHRGGSLSEVCRVANIEEKIETGCQVWE
jgi:phenylacetate-coenzyme A ligase PaaK-like adenylate-forming protein